MFYPFGAPEAIDDELIGALRTVLGGVAAFSVRFETLGRFGDQVLYLEPKSSGLDGLIHRLAGRFPEYPPYGGAHDMVVPHLTVAGDSDGADLGPLPVQCRGNCRSKQRSTRCGS